MHININVSTISSCVMKGILHKTIVNYILFSKKKLISISGVVWKLFKCCRKVKTDYFNPSCQSISAKEFLCTSCNMYLHAISFHGLYMAFACTVLLPCVLFNNNPWTGREPLPWHIPGRCNLNIQCPAFHQGIWGRGGK